LSFAILSFTIRCQGEPLVEWNYAQKHMVWGLIYLFAGGSALGQILSETGTAQWVADKLVPLAGGGGFVAVGVFSLLTMMLTQITSNTAAVAIVVPITIGTFQSLGLNPIPFVYIVTVAGNCGLMLPSSAGGPAVAAGYGVNLKTMFVRGLWLTALLWLVIFLAGYLMATYWPGFGAADFAQAARLLCVADRLLRYAHAVSRSREVRQRRAAGYTLCRPEAAAVPGNQDRQVFVRVRVAVGDGAAVDDHHVIQQRAVAVGRVLQLAQELGEQLGVEDIDQFDLGDIFQGAAMVRQRMVRLGNADFGILRRLASRPYIGDIDRGGRPASRSEVKTIGDQRGNG
jgi:hypothetical protein